MDLLATNFAALIEEWRPLSRTIVLLIAFLIIANIFLWGLVSILAHG